jgi:hypothetical protein
MKTRFIDNPDYDFNKVNNASQACGPLVKWAKAQVNRKYHNFQALDHFHFTFNF